MAFPLDMPDQLYHGQVLRERIIPFREQTPLIQKSRYFDNFVFGDHIQEDIEHEPSIPLLKLIDFGRPRLENLENWKNEGLENLNEIGSRINLITATWDMMKLCCTYATDEDLFTPHSNPRSYLWMDGSNQRQVYTTAPRILRVNAMLNS
ncbi:hypothetical protein HD806DRAFT_542327 [Xylariaceae sp. AK1471]|nr:hypothetical protein HD806DRAFT_542327 [Xylariaceae sp. AK1471]